MSDKKVPNPGGRLGGKEHRSLVEKIQDWIIGRDLIPDRETQIDCEHDKKRYADVTVINEKGIPTEIHQVGRTNKNGTPVSHERKAIEDIEKATGLKVIFHPLVILAIIGLAILYLIQQ